MNTTFIPQYSLLERVGQLFYIVDYKSTSFRTVDEVPEYMHGIVPVYVALIIIEYIVLWIRGKKTPRIGDGFISIGHGMLYEIAEVFIKGFELIGYSWMYKYRVMSFDWDSPITWWTAAIFVDFISYWAHRASHEMACLWSIHQVHHSSEDLNLTTATRMPVFGIHRFALPLALLGIPLPSVIVHMHFNLIFQFWVHTEAIGRCGPLEWIFNTPSHHRVHHGSNPYCLDKNYGAYLIIWDKMFGTFEAERDEEEIVYGLVSQPQSYNIFYLQFFNIKEVFEKCLAQETLGDKLRALFYGPGWFSGTPRLGHLPSKEHLKRNKYDPSLDAWMVVYFTLHGLVILYIQQLLVLKTMEFSAVSFMILCGYICLCLGVIGAMYDGWYWAPLLEASRCVIYIAYACNFPVTPFPLLDTILLIYFVVSAAVWTTKSMHLIRDLQGIVKKME